MIFAVRKPVLFFSAQQINAKLSLSNQKSRSLSIHVQVHP
eukprot:COSAG02_NODE_281_length_25776_cov_37.797998_8_plen_40_part_00